MHLLVAEEDFWTLCWTTTTPSWILAASRTPPLVGLWLHSSWLASHTHSPCIPATCHPPLYSTYTYTHHFFITFLSNTHFQQSLPTLSSTHSHLHLTLFQLPTLISNNHHDCQRPRNPKTWAEQLQSMEWRNAGLAQGKPALATCLWPEKEA